MGAVTTAARCGRRDGRRGRHDHPSGCAPAGWARTSASGFAGSSSGAASEGASCSALCLSSSGCLPWGPGAARRLRLGRAGLRLRRRSVRWGGCPCARRSDAEHRVLGGKLRGSGAGAGAAAGAFVPADFGRALPTIFFGADGGGVEAGRAAAERVRRRGCRCGLGCRGQLRAQAPRSERTASSEVHRGRELASPARRFFRCQPRRAGRAAPFSGFPHGAVVEV